jgi:hypothetical protein
MARKVDQSALKTNQVFIILLLLVGFVLNSVPPVAFVGAVMLIGTAAPQFALFKQIYHRLLRPANLVKPEVITDNPEPHRFAQGFGGVVVVVAVIALLGNLAVVGWSLVWLVIALAAANLFLGFCAGCTLYYQLNRWGVRGFEQRPIQ